MSDSISSWTVAKYCEMERCETYIMETPWEKDSCLVGWCARAGTAPGEIPRFALDWGGHQLVYHLCRVMCRHVPVMWLTGSDYQDKLVCHVHHADVGGCTCVYTSIMYNVSICILLYAILLFIVLLELPSWCVIVWVWNWQICVHDILKRILHVTLIVWK